MQTFADIRVEKDVEASMRDGIKLRADIYRPSDTGSYPVLLLRIPYNKELSQTYVYAHPAWYARQGYIVVVQDTRGRFRSDGEFDPLDCETFDGHDSIEWCSTLPFSTGEVGTFGFSISGLGQLLAAKARPRGLKAACLAMYSNDVYHGFAYRGGAFALATVASWLGLLAWDRQRRIANTEYAKLAQQAADLAGRWSPAVSVEELPLFKSNPVLPFAREMLAHPTFDAFWKREYLDPANPPTWLPCLHISGWYDTFVTQTLDTFSAMLAAQRADQRLIVGPWAHMPWARKVGDLDFGPDASGKIIDRAQVAFFNAHLKGDFSALDGMATASLFLLGENKWRHLTSWPPVEAKSLTLYLRSGGQANSSEGDGVLSLEQPTVDPADFFIHDPTNPVPSVGGNAFFDPRFAPMGPADQREIESRNDVLCYTSQTFDEDVVLIGRVHLELYASSTVRHTDFTAKLCRIAKDGSAINLCEGIRRVDRGEQADQYSSVETYQINLGELCIVLQTGESLRLEIASSSFPTFDINRDNISEQNGYLNPVAHQVVFHDAERMSCLKIHPYD